MENKKVSKSLNNIREGIYSAVDIDCIREYVEKLESGMDKACKELETFDITFNDKEHGDIKNKLQWKEWCIKNE